MIVPVYCTPINKAEYQVSVKHTEFHWVYLAPPEAKSYGTEIQDS